MLNAARNSGRILYRGFNKGYSISPDFFTLKIFKHKIYLGLGKASYIISEKSDLLDPNTYGSSLAAEVKFINFPLIVNHICVQ